MWIKVWLLCLVVLACIYRGWCFSTVALQGRFMVNPRFRVNNKRSQNFVIGAMNRFCNFPDFDRIRVMDQSRSNLPHVEYEVFDPSEPNNYEEHTKTPQETWQDWRQRRVAEDALMQAIATEKNEENIQPHFKAHKTNLAHTKVAILNANERFFYAQCMGEMHHLRALWAPSDDVVCMTSLINMQHPEGATIIGGHQNVMNYFAKHTPTLHDYLLRNINLMFYGDMAVVTCLVLYFAEPSGATKRREAVLMQYVTNVFCKEEHGDRYLLHSHMTSPYALPTTDPRANSMGKLRNTYKDPSIKPPKKAPSMVDGLSNLFSRLIGGGGGGGNGGNSTSVGGSTVGVGGGTTSGGGGGGGGGGGTNNGGGSSGVEGGNSGGSNGGVLIDGITGAVYKGGTTTGTNTHNTPPTIHTPPPTITPTTPTAIADVTSYVPYQLRVPPRQAVGRMLTLTDPPTDPDTDTDTTSTSTSIGNMNTNTNAIATTNTNTMYNSDMEPNGGMESSMEYDETEYEDEEEDESSFDDQEDEDGYGDIVMDDADSGNSDNSDNSGDSSVSDSGSSGTKVSSDGAHVGTIINELHTTTLPTTPSPVHTMYGITLLHNTENNPIIDNLQPGLMTREQSTAVRVAVMMMAQQPGGPPLPPDGKFLLLRPAGQPHLMVDVLAGKGRGVVSVYDGEGSGDNSGSGNTVSDKFIPKWK